MQGNKLMEESVLIYLSNNGVNSGTIASRFRMILDMLQKFINIKKISQSIIVDKKKLKLAIISYFIDTARIKEFHNIPNTNTEKIYGYMAYWLYRRKPIQVIKDFPGSEFINELFIATYIITGILAEKSLKTVQVSQYTIFEEFQELLLYNFKYRTITQQSLELMINAFYTGCYFKLPS